MRLGLAGFVLVYEEFICCKPQELSQCTSHELAARHMSFPSAYPELSSARPFGAGLHAHVLCADNRSL